MAPYGIKLPSGSKRRDVCLLTLIFILFSTCAGLGIGLYGAKKAHESLWKRLKAQERKILEMQQTVTEYKVEKVDAENKNKNLEDQTRQLTDAAERNRQLVEAKERQIATLTMELEQTRQQNGESAAKIDELDRRLSHRQTEAHVLKKALDQYKHQIADLTQELDLFKSRLKNVGLIQEVHTVIPDDATEKSNNLKNADIGVDGMNENPERSAASAVATALQTGAQENMLE